MRTEHLCARRSRQRIQHGGVQREEKCDHCGTAQETGHIQKQKEKQNGIGGVQAYVGHMVAGGVFAV